MARHNNATENFGLSFLDVICCGFGAVILLLIITKTGQPEAQTEAVSSSASQFESLREQLLRLRSENRKEAQALDAVQAQLSQAATALASVEADLLAQQSSAGELEIESKSQQAISGQLEQARQRLSAEMRRLQQQQQPSENQLIGGIPVDSEYLVFIIDTSGSMFSAAWPRMLREFEATLNIYPKVKGIQVMNDMGQYLFSNYRGKWIPDTPSRRQLMIRQLRYWNVFSNSSPTEGIAEAIRTYYASDKKISLYVFGDEFSGNSIDAVMRSIAKLNPKDRDGKHRVRIHAVGFPVQFSVAGNQAMETGIRFATLMRQLAWENGGTFVGLNNVN